jgi:hypothetical protein
VGPRASLDDRKRNILPLPELELQSLCRPARSQSPWRLRYHGSYVQLVTKPVLLFGYGTKWITLYKKRESGGRFVIVPLQQAAGMLPSEKWKTITETQKVVC